MTEALTEGQTPLVTVHRKELVPVDNAITGEAGLPGELTVELPAITDQEPVPTVGITAARLAEAEQRV